MFHRLFEIKNIWLKFVVFASIMMFVPATLYCIKNVSFKNNENILNIDTIADSYGVIKEQHMVDDKIPPPSFPIDDSIAALFLEPGAYVLFDLGIPQNIRAFQLITRRNTLDISVSLDAKSFTNIPSISPDIDNTIYPLSNFSSQFSPVLVRYIKLSLKPGIDKSAVTEFLAFNEVPKVFPVILNELSTPSYKARVQKALSRYNSYIIISIVILVLVFWVLLNLSSVSSRQKNTLALILIIISLGIRSGYVNISDSINNIGIWDITHYYLGAKYFKELKYNNLYNCILKHEIEKGRQKELDNAVIRNLDNYKVSSIQSFSSTNKCEGLFTQNRWEKFGHDVDGLRRLFINRKLPDILVDHGYNGTPILTETIDLLVSHIPVSFRNLSLLGCIDDFLVITAILAIWWGFGATPAVLCAVFICFGEYWNYNWIGGALLRFFWLTALCLSVACFKKKKWFYGGLFLAISAVYRLFPFVFMAGIGISILRSFWLRKEVHKHILIILGLAIPILLAGILPSLKYGPQTYKRFIINSELHAQELSDNINGLGHLVSSDLGALVNKIDNNSLNHTNFSILTRKVLWSVGLIVSLLFLIKGVVRFETWALIPLAIPLLFSSVPLSGYYYIFNVLLASLVGTSKYRIILLLPFIAYSSLTMILLPNTTLAVKYFYNDILMLIIYVLFFVSVLRDKEAFPLQTITIP